MDEDLTKSKVCFLFGLFFNFFVAIGFDIGLT